ncbi:MAG TPA: RNA-binding protein [Bacillales bacterium]|nr:RNA-binding protein [Bacillales bacterium]
MNIYQHFRPEEKDFVDQVIGWKDYVENAYASKLTDFLDPREQHILTMIIGQHSEVKCQFFGGNLESERKRAILFPEYTTPDQEDFQICLFEVEYPKKFITIEHPQVLGSLMSLGLKRAKFGDILTQENRIQFFVCQEVSDYVKTQVQSIGKATVALSSLDLSNAISSSELWVEETIMVSSLRLDTFISGIHHVSRQKSQNFIQQGLAKVNWMYIENPSFECAAGDMISLRGYGRVKILSIEGKTKKEKWRIIAGKQK